MNSVQKWGGGGGGGGRGGVRQFLHFLVGVMVKRLLAQSHVGSGSEDRLFTVVSLSGEGHWLVLCLRQSVVDLDQAKSASNVDNRSNKVDKELNNGLRHHKKGAIARVNKHKQWIRSRSIACIQNGSNKIVAENKDRH